MATKCPLQPIPQPPKHLFGLLGNIPDIDITAKSTSYSRLAAEYGAIYKLDLVGKEITILSSHELVNETFDETRFEKVLGTLREVRHAAGDGLITALTTEPNWKLAHKLLLGPLGPMAIRAMFPKMLDIISQMILKWDRLGSTPSHDATDNFTRLSFDIIALCAFDYRCNSFYGDTAHPFVSSMVGMLEEANRRFSRTGLENKIRMWSQRSFDRDISTMHSIVDDIIADRRRNPQESGDILNNLLNARDKETGEGLSDENIRYQVLTLLAAGHETTSGLLSFTIYLLLKNPDEFHKAVEEIDAVLGNDVLTIRHLPQLKYIKAVLKESLRLHPPAGQIVLHSKEGSGRLGCKYAYTSDDLFVINLNDMHKDPKVWGPDAAAFKPERMLDGSFEKLPPNSWKPWGNGQRECIGREFAMQEAIMTMALILQRFELEMADPSYSLKISQTITQKPLGFAIKVKRREGKGMMVGLQAEDPGLRLCGPQVMGLDSGRLPDTGRSLPGVKMDNSLPTLCPLPHVTSQDQTPTTHASSIRTPLDQGDTRRGLPVAIFYGSNSGTCKSFVEDVRSSLPNFGLVCHATQTLDAATDNIPRDRPVVVVAPSYEGLPSDDSKKFVSWLEALAEDSKALEGVRYSVCGFGNSDWANTFHRIPKLIDDLMQKQAAQRFAPLGLVDVAGDVFAEFEDWWTRLIPALTGPQICRAEAGPLERPRLGHPVSGLGRLGSYRGDGSLNRGEKAMKLGTVLVIKQLAGDEVGLAKRHMEIALPEGMKYSPGDYIVVQPSNCRTTILRVLNRFHLPVDAVADLEDPSKSFESKNSQDPYESLAHTVELNYPATRLQIATLSSLTSNSSEKLHLDTLAGSLFDAQILKPRTSILDLLELSPSCTLPFSAYLTMLAPLKPRHYSISSSPLASPTTATITYDVLRSPALSNPDRIHHGVASTYLAQLVPGNQLRCRVRASTNNFHLPDDAKTPIIMIAAGTGIAPFRGFIQHRAFLSSSDPTTPPNLGKAILYYNSRSPSLDFLYRSEISLWQKAGIVDLRPCFSREPEACGGWRYVGERIWAEREELVGVWREGGKVFVCGSRGLAEGVGEVGARVWAEVKGEGAGVDAERGREWVRGERGGRFVVDVFG